MVRVRGELDLDSCDLLLQVLTDALRRDAVNRVDVDLADLEFLDASGVSALLSFRSLVQAQGKALRLRQATGLPLRVLAITGVLGLLDAKEDDAAGRGHAG